MVTNTLGRNDLARTKKIKTHDWSPIGCKAVVTGWSEPCDAGEFGQAAIGAATGKDGDDVDGFRDQGTRDGDDGFLDELLEPAQCSERGAGMDGADAARMACAPGLEQIESLGAAHLADRNAIGPQAQRRTDQIRQRDHAVLGAQRHEIRRLALKFSRVFDENDPIRGLGDFRQQRVGQRRLAAGGAAGDQDVLARCDRAFATRSAWSEVMIPAAT